MKRALFILLAVLLLFGCMGTKKAKNRPDLYTLAACSFVGPRIGLSNRTRDSLVEADIEVDLYGRELVTVWNPDAGFYNLTGGKDENAFVPFLFKMILQQHDESHIYYYEDYCFLIETEKGFSEESIEAFKEKNDWNSPIRIEKCSSRFYDSYKDINLGAWKDPDAGIRRAVERSFSGFKTVNVEPIDADSKGKILCGVFAFDEQGFYKSYYAIYDPMIKGVDSEKGMMELTSLEFGQELHELKTKNGWNFSECPQKGWSFGT